MTKDFIIFLLFCHFWILSTLILQMEEKIWAVNNNQNPQFFKSTKNSNFYNDDGLKEFDTLTYLNLK